MTPIPQPGEIWYHRHLKLTLNVHIVDRRRNLVCGWVGKAYVTRFLSHFSNYREGWQRVPDN